VRIIDIDSPGLKDILWHKMRDDLGAYIPEAVEKNLLMCPACCRFLPFDEFCVEHIVPQQALADDPLEVRVAIPKNERARTILLCRRRLLIKGKVAYDNGCNSWKGRFYDSFLREIFNSKFVNQKQMTTRHQVALFSAGYLGLFEQYGYQITLVQSGLVMRQQFFYPNNFLKSVPGKCQMVLVGAPDLKYSEESKRYWSPPFKFTFHRDSILTVVRSVSMYLPASRDPDTPIVRVLPFAPPKYAFRPNFQTVFH
jgi:hypothetical protein